MYQSINYKFEKPLKIAYWLFDNEQADVAELVDATDPKSKTNIFQKFSYRCKTLQLSRLLE